MFYINLIVINWAFSLLLMFIYLLSDLILNQEVKVCLILAMIFILLFMTYDLSLSYTVIVLIRSYFIGMFYFIFERSYELLLFNILAIIIYHVPKSQHY